jgi:IS4 transposase
MEGFHAELLKRLPLAQAVLTLWAWVMCPEVLGGLYEEHRGRGYERALSFAQLVGLVRDALLEHQGSGRQSFERAREQELLDVSNSSAYEKLGRLPVALSQAFLSLAGSRLAEALPQEGVAVVLPESLKGLEVMVLDGKTVKHVARRLKPLRRQAGKITGGKAVVALDLRRGLAVAMEADPNGNRNDVPLVPGLIAQVRGTPVLWVGDRQYCDLKLPLLLSQDGNHFLVRYSNNVSFEADPAREATQGMDSGGRKWKQEWGWLGSAKNPRGIYVRRIHLELEGEEALEVVTGLLDPLAYPAEDLLEAYGQRWGIERVFQQITEVFELRRLIGSTPQATIFQASFCLVLYNMIQVVRAYAAQDGQKQVQEVSTEQVFYDVRRDLTAWDQASDPPQTLALVLEELPRTAAGLRAALGKMFRGTWTDRWIKTPSTRHTPRRLDTPMPPCGRTTVWAALNAADGPATRKRRP